jgi:Tfp pilus assembly protein PilF
VALARVKSLLERAIHLDPKLGIAYLQLGIFYSDQKDLPNAIAEYRYAIDADSRLEEAHYRLAHAYRQAGKTTEAEAELRLYKQISKEKTAEVERERHEVKQFEYQLREPIPSSQPK